MKFIVYDSTGKVVTWTNDGSDALADALRARGMIVLPARTCWACEGKGLIPTTKEDEK